MKHDHTAHQPVEKMTDIRIDLIEYAATHTLNELITRALDKIQALVDSAIGFFHFVEADQKTLSLQQWSTRTLTEFCRAEGKGMHYPIEQAGVWADGARRKKPVIHNDYAALKQKQGMPVGHAEVVRELVVPVMRRGRVVAILGVGNKSVDYTEKDVEIVSYLADVTWEIFQRKRTQEALIDSEKRYRRLFESAKDGILILDADSGKIVDINPFLSRLLGCQHTELLGKHLWEIGTFAGIAASKDAFKTLQDKAYIRYDHLPLETVDGRIVEVEFVSNVYLVDNAKVIQCNIRDITERKQADAERERLLAAIEQVGEMIVITNPDGTIQYVNPAFERVTGYSRDEAIGKNPRILNSGEQGTDFNRNLWETISAGNTFQGRMVNKRKDGTFFTEEATISPVCDPSGRIVSYVAVKRDITENLKLAAQFQQSQKMESVGRLAGGVAHDYNNMLSVIIGYTELALEKVDPSDPLHANLHEIFTAAMRSTEITRQLLAFARKQTISPKVLDVNGTVEGMLTMLRRLIGEDIDLSWRPEARLRPVKMDPAQIDQILANLCVNARDAIAGVGKITIETHMVKFDAAYCADHAGFVPGDFVLLAVSDDGCGMDKETLDNIFEPFFTTKEVNQGTGLGLATVFGIVKQNNGFINVYSEPGNGTTFRIYLPPHVGEAEKTGTETVATIPSGQGEMVLLVEDEPAIMKMSQKMLERLGYQVLATGTPSEALRLAGNHAGEIHLLVTDVVMPEMNGRNLADQLCAQFPDIKTLFMSGYTANVIAHRGVLDEGVNFIQKPFSIKDLGIKVRATLDQK
ncbi:PAS domain S-box protein [Desulfosarcina sp.]|uniref:PAS domain S-box protein n=1 Tax=Desulfosarcina sp. TaxID=2027861 RepID=UPI003970D6FE